MASISCWLAVPAVGLKMISTCIHLSWREKAEIIAEFAPQQANAVAIKTLANDNNYHYVDFLSAPPLPRRVIMLQLARIPPQSVLPHSPTTARHLSLLPAAAPLPVVQQLGQLEQQIRSHKGLELHADWLNADLVRWMALACRAAQRQLTALQDSWPTRLYTSLRDAALNTSLPSTWRQLCLDSLHQPFFVLSHLYREQPGRGLRLRALLHEFALLSRLG